MNHFLLIMFFLFVSQNLFVFAQIEYDVMNAKRILTHPLKKHVLSFINHEESYSYSSLVDLYPSCLFLYLRYHQKNRDILRYFNETLPYKRQKTAFIDHGNPQLSVTILPSSLLDLSYQLNLFCLSPKKEL